MKRIKKVASYLGIAFTALLISNKTNAGKIVKNEDVNTRVNKVRAELIRKFKSGDLGNISTDQFLKNKFNETGWGNWGNWGNWNNWNNWADWAKWAKWVNFLNE
jgi:hypothetical protein